MRVLPVVFREQELFHDLKQGASSLWLCYVSALCSKFRGNASQFFSAYDFAYPKSTGIDIDRCFSSYKVSYSNDFLLHKLATSISEAATGRPSLEASVLNLCFRAP